MENVTQNQKSNFERKSFEPLPAGDYKARLVSFEIKPNRAGTGTNGSAQFEIIGGDFKKRKVYHTFLIEHPNEKAVGFSNNKLNKLLTACGSENSIEDMGFDYTQIMDETGEMPLVIGVDTNEYEKDGQTVIGNRITSFKRR